MDESDDESRASVRFPIQPAKIAQPPLRDDTLQRDRLLDWLAAKVHRRAVFVIAEAGFGKTTLLADFSRRTRQRTLWYRLDEEDRDPIAFLNYLVAAGRDTEPGFAPTTSAMLREFGTGTISHDQVVSTFSRELQVLGERGAILIIDDYHLVDDSPDVRRLIEEMLVRGPERLTLVLLTRRRPALSIARLRALGEVVELGTDDLRFLPEETERLFRESYGQPLEADVLLALASRTEGWAASLQLVRSAVRDRSPSEIRTFVSGLTGTHEELYDYLAEEVVGDLDPAMQRFLMRTAVLQSIDPELAGLVTGDGEHEAKTRIEAAERSGLLGRRGGVGRRTHRYHPLVRDYLLERLVRDAGPDGVAELHRVVARWAETRDWRLAAHHFAAAGDAADLHRVLITAISQVMATGEFILAETLLARHPVTQPEPAFEVFLSRLDYYRNRIDQSLARAQWAADHADPATRPTALVNLAAIEYMCGRIEAALETASQFAGPDSPPRVRRIAEALGLLAASADDGDLDNFGNLMRTLAADQLADGDLHHAGISELNLSIIHLAQGHPNQAKAAATSAIELLERGAPRPEANSAYSMRAIASAQMGQSDEATSDVAKAQSSDHRITHVESLIEGALADLWFGPIDRAERQLTSAAQDSRLSPSVRFAWELAQAELSLEIGETDSAAATLPLQDAGSAMSTTGEHARLKTLRARCALALGHGSAKQLSIDALDHATTQKAWLWADVSRLLIGLSSTSKETGEAVAVVSTPGALSMLATPLSEHLDNLADEALQRIREEAEVRPVRWRRALRAAVDRDTESPALSAARLLDLLGESEDVLRLRRFVRRHRLRGPDGLLGRNLARALAPRVIVEDLGRTTIRVGVAVIPGSSLRRKALALLIYLVSRPGFSATREQVMEALWPDHEPSDAVNSVNQTAYFLRRVFEPKFSEDLSPGYLHADSEVMWLDRELVNSRSATCRDLIDGASVRNDIEAIERLSEAYVDQFALDFIYDEWASTHRDRLHAAYLEIIERAVSADVNAGHFDRAVRMARRAIEVDPESEPLHVMLIRISRSMGAYAAAADRYAAYGSLLRSSYGVEPPPIEVL